jgi:dolichol-phosphate mannosyltransferase
MRERKILGSEIAIHEFKSGSRRSKFAWIVVERNEGNRFQKQLGRMIAANSGCDIIIIDGDSSDESISIDELEAKGVRDLIVSKAKFGFSKDLQIGLLHAIEKGYAGVITSDGNGKDSVHDIARFIFALENDYDFLQGSRFLEPNHHKNTPLFRWVGIRLISSPITSLFAGSRITDPTNGFRGYSRKLLLHPRVQLGRRKFKGYALVSYLPIAAGKANLLSKEISVSRDYPDRGGVPTKIVRISQWLEIFFDLFRAGFEIYDEYSNDLSIKLPAD